MAQRLAPGTAPAAPATPGLARASTTPSGKPAPSTPGPRRKPALSSRAAPRRRCFTCGGCKAAMDASGKVISRVPCEAWAKQAETDERAESGLGDCPTQDYRVQFMLVNSCIV